MPVANIRSLSSSLIGVRIDRTSPVGNPFYVAKESDRDPACDAYEDYLVEMISLSISYPESVDRVLELVRRLAMERKLLLATSWRAPTPREFVDYLDSIGLEDVLLCWCTPRRCHGHSILKYKSNTLLRLL